MRGSSVGATITPPLSPRPPSPLPPHLCVGSGSLSSSSSLSLSSSGSSMSLSSATGLSASLTTAKRAQGPTTPGGSVVSLNDARQAKMQMLYEFLGAHRLADAERPRGMGMGM